MTEGQSTAIPAQPPPPSILGGLLSYLVPGLGQIYQGRVGKGVMFMVILLGMFFLGQAMGGWRNVYMPPEPTEGNPIRKPLASVYDRWHFAGQFWIGIAAWPAIWQFYWTPDENDYVEVAQDRYGHEIPGAKIVMLDGRPTAVDAQDRPIPDARVVRALPFWRAFQRAPSEDTLNNFITDSDKAPDLGWVYTVVAGMLNILVIYDAVMGPAIIALAKPAEQTAESKPVAEGTAS